MTSEKEMLQRLRSLALSRRDLLRAAAAAALTALLPASGRAAAAPMRMRTVPTTGERIPVMGLGTSDAFETGADAASAPLREVLARFYALGGRLIDTSPTYGNAEAVVGRLAAELELTDRLFLATKVHEVGRQAGIDQMEASRRRLGRRRLDLIQVHNLVDVDTQLATLRRWKEQGLVRYVGITHYRVAAFDALERLMRTVPLDFVQFNYSVATPDAEQHLLPLARERGIAVLVNRAFEDGYLFRVTRGRTLPPWAADFDCTSWAQFFLKYVLANEAVTCVIPATSKPGHLVDNMGAGVGRLPDAATCARMRAFIQSV
ncbi:MAG: aldo/keto reductase [Gammaproteobacteria bacterium]|jgi:aryl-alcohol dehydrogenase-like predicted oxidoreductase